MKKKMFLKNFKLANLHFIIRDGTLDSSLISKTIEAKDPTYNPLIFPGIQLYKPL